ncbi:MAG: alpha/beta fold hydrolase [Gammaproteobacteria bacterium]|nr:alpha/beta fold hydrolase [Gammaproteobacteria bacterium]
MQVVFSHGKESGPWGRKIQQLSQVVAQQGLDFSSVDYTDLECPEQRVVRLQAILAEATQPTVLVGSSMGGYVSMVAAGEYPVAGLFLLAPALFMEGYAQQLYQPQTPIIELVHGWQDDIVAVEHSLRFAQNFESRLHLLHDDHRLRKTLLYIENLFSTFLDNVKQHALTID